MGRGQRQPTGTSEQLPTRHRLDTQRIEGTNIDRQMRAREEEIQRAVVEEEAKEPNAAEDPYDSDAGVAPISSSDPAYYQRRKMARNLAQYE